MILELALFQSSHNFSKPNNELGVIHKRRPQGGGRGFKGKGTRADIGGGGPSKGGRPQKKFESW